MRPERNIRVTCFFEKIALIDLGEPFVCVSFCRFVFLKRKRRCVSRNCCAGSKRTCVLCGEFYACTYAVALRFGNVLVLRFEMTKNTQNVLQQALHPKRSKTQNAVFSIPGVAHCWRQKDKNRNFAKFGCARGAGSVTPSVTPCQLPERTRTCRFLF